ncbi:MAG: carbon storage regulator CsrA [Phycisphaerales bacterium]
MLVLSRQRDETIMIGDHIELTVVDIRGDKVRIGIKAPSDVPVHRKEIYDAIRSENEQASRMGCGDVPSLAKEVRQRTRFPGNASNNASRLPEKRESA